MHPKISIITVAYNSEATIETTILSVLEQTYQNYEYWIIDGASTDHTVEIARSYEKAFADKGIAYHILSEPDTGIYNAMNKGIRKSTGELVGMINSDDWYEPDALEKVAAHYEKTGFDYMYGNLRILKESGEMIKKARIGKIITSRDWNHPTTFVRKTVYKQMQYREKSLYDDFELLVRVRLGGYKVSVLDEILANFRFGGVSNEKNFKKAVQRMKTRYEIYRSNGLSRLYLLECIGIELAKYLAA